MTPYPFLSPLASAACLLALCLLVPTHSPGTAASGDLRPSARYPWYWEYRGRPVLLLGGTIEDNLYQIPGLRGHLDTLRAAGGNYVRNTMSCRDAGNAWWFERGPAGKYDLNRPGEEHWRRFDEFLRLAHERDIVVQIEVWDRFDFAREPWLANPYNPANNSNYTAAQSGLAAEYPEHPGHVENPFFRSVPALENNAVLLPIQERQVRRMLRTSLSYPNVLYCMDNETQSSPEWGRYWARIIREEARAAGREVYQTEMWDPWDLNHPLHRETLDHPDLYAFADISQNNHQRGRQHWDNAQAVRARLAGRPRPLNNVKIYGADGGRYGSTRDGLERFWRNIVGGLASARFHRPDSGLGLSETAQVHLRAARLVTDAAPLFEGTPGLELLGERAPNETYLNAIPGKQYVLYFPDGGAVTLDLAAASGTFRVRWMEASTATWHPGETVSGGAVVPLRAPGTGHWVAVLRAEG